MRGKQVEYKVTINHKSIQRGCSCDSRDVKNLYCVNDKKWMMWIKNQSIFKIWILHQEMKRLIMICHNKSS